MSNWLNGARDGRVRIPGARRIAERYLVFRLELPKMCHAQNFDPHELPFIDYRRLVTGWLVENEW